MDKLRHEKSFCVCLLNKDADDLDSNRVAGQPLVFCYIVNSYNT